MVSQEEDLVRPAEDGPARRTGGWRPVALFAAVVLGLAFVAWLSGQRQTMTWLLVTGVIGAAFIWRQANPEQWRRLAASRVGKTVVTPAWTRGFVGGLLVVGGLAGFVAYSGELDAARPGLAAAAAIIAGVGVMLAPRLLRMARELDAERKGRIRATERAELAAKVHDSVLHTLTMIQRGADDPRLVQRLARSQERELRAWLHAPDDPAAQESLSAQLAAVAGGIEDAYGVPIDVVQVGDLPLGERTWAAVHAAREAMLNAAKYSGTPQISVYAEAEPDRLSVFVKDRGCGFNLDDVPAHRLGVRESIVGRIGRAGGSAHVRSAPGEGTEVEIRLTRHG